VSFATLLQQKHEISIVFVFFVFFLPQNDLKMHHRATKDTEEIILKISVNSVPLWWN